MTAVDPLCAAVLRLGIALLLLSSALHKVRDVRVFRAAMHGYALLPARWVSGAAMLTITAEAALGLGVLLPRRASFAAAGAALLLSIYTAAIAIALSRGRTRIDCGCAGAAGALPLSPALVVRNVLLIILALGAALPTALRALQVTDLIIIALATLTFAFLYVATETALANAARWRDVPPFGKGRSGGIFEIDHSGKSPSVPLFQRGKV